MEAVGRCSLLSVAPNIFDENATVRATKETVYIKQYLHGHTMNILIIDSLANKNIEHERYFRSGEVLVLDIGAVHYSSKSLLIKISNTQSLTSRPL